MTIDSAICLWPGFCSCFDPSTDIGGGLGRSGSLAVNRQHTESVAELQMVFEGRSGERKWFSRRWDGALREAGGDVQLGIWAHEVQEQRALR